MAKQSCATKRILTSATDEEIRFPEQKKAFLTAHAAYQNLRERQEGL